MADDLGYADLGCQGAEDFDTPHLDRLAASGARLTSYYSAASTCSPARAALLTGRYPDRLGIVEDFTPARTGDADTSTAARQGLKADEVTLAELLREKGYATACIGNWHLGDAPEFLPARQGFDAYFGIPYSNDLGKSPGVADDKGFPPLPLLEGVKVVETSPDQRFLTQRYTKKALAFLAAHHRAKPCFLYLAYSAPHVPLFVSPKYSGSARYGLYGDVVRELDAGIGEILAGLETLGMQDNTLVIFTSDNGPNLARSPHAGRAEPYRDGADTRFEGGHRVPCLVRWPDQLPAGRVADGLCASIDWLPTLAGLAGAALPADRKIDGLDLWPYLSGSAATSPRTRFFYSEWVVRDGPWKLMLPGKYREVSPRPPRQEPGGWTSHAESRLYHLDDDPGERKSLTASQTEKVTELAAALKAYQDELHPPPPPEPEPPKKAAKKK